ncbi:MAG: phage/plasmid primase, P4 family [Chloroflexota bacterium]
MWDGQHWKEDALNSIGECVTHVTDLYIEAAQRVSGKILVATQRGENASKDQMLFGKLVRQSKKYRDLPKINAVKTLASAQRDLVVKGDIWGQDPYILGVLNGDLDFRTGELTNGVPERYIKDVCNAEWKGLDEPAPLYAKFLSELWANPDYEPFVQRLSGYAATGLTNERKIFVYHGAQGQNGKTVLMNTLNFVLGEYMDKGASDILIEKKYNSGGSSAQPQIVNMLGRHIMCFSETRQGARLDAATVKELTGGDGISTRRLYGETFTISAIPTLFLLTNHLPHISSEDNALWYRMVLVPFEMSYVDNPTKPHERLADQFLEEKLKAETSGILAWLVKGFMEYSKRGLDVPESIKNEAKKYKDSEDAVGTFLVEYTVNEGEIQASKLYRLFLDDQKGNQGIKNPMSNAAFSRRMTTLGHKKEIKRNVAYWQSISLSPDAPVVDVFAGFNN